MGEPRSSASRNSTPNCSPNSSPSCSSSATPPPPPPLPTSTTTLVRPTSQKKKHKNKVFRVFRSVFRSFPILTTTTCKFPPFPGGIPDSHHQRGVAGGTKITGTLFGYRKGRISLSLQENPRCFPSLIVELAMHTNTLLKELSTGMVRIALECEKRADKDKTRLLDEPLWTMFCNGKKSGYGVKKEPTEEDLGVMQLLRAVSMGVGVLPGNSETDGVDGEIAYMRAHFEHVVGSRDSEILYMLSPEGNSGPELTIFFVRI